LINAVLFIYYPSVVSSDIPLLEITEQLDTLLKNCYTFILWLAAFVSLANACFCLIKRVQDSTGLNSKLAGLLICIISIPFSGLGFSKLVAYIYPFFGYAGIAFTLMILVTGVRELLNLRKL
jgi:uncharacterized membrane protein YkvI